MKETFTIYVLPNPSIRGLLARDAGWSLMVRAAALGVATVLHIALARWMGPTQYGVFALATSWLLIAVTVAKFGFDTTSLRFLAAYESVADWAQLRGFLRYSRWVVLASGFLTTILALVVLFALRTWISTQLFTALGLAFLGVTVAAQSQLVQSQLRAFRRVALAQFPDPILRSVLLGSMAAVILYVTGDLTGTQAVGLNLIALACVLGFSLCAFQRVVPVDGRKGEYAYSVWEWQNVAMSALLIASMQFILYQTDIVMVGALLGTRHTGPYAVATKVAALALFFLGAINAILAPMIARFYARRELAELQRLVVLACRAITAFTVPVVLGMLLWGEAILGLFGDEFRSAYMVLVILTSGQLVNALAGPAGFLMTMTGNHQTAAWVYGSTAFLNIMLNTVFISLFGIGGAAMATALSTATSSIALIIMTRRKLGIRISLL